MGGWPVTHWQGSLIGESRGPRGAALPSPHSYVPLSRPRHPVLGPSGWLLPPLACALRVPSASYTSQARAPPPTVPGPNPTVEPQPRAWEMGRKRPVVVTKARGEHSPEERPGGSPCSLSPPAPLLRSSCPLLNRRRENTFPFLSLLPRPGPCPLPRRLSLRLLAAAHATQGSHLAPMVVLRAKEISDCGVSIIDNKAPRTLITLLPHVLRAHNQVRGRRGWKCCRSPTGKPAPLPSYCSPEIPV